MVPRTVSSKELEVQNVERVLGQLDMGYNDIIMWCQRKKQEAEAEVAVHEAVRARPLDGAYALAKAATELFGWTERRASFSFFGKKPPTEVSVEVSYGEYIKVPWGKLAIPDVDGELMCQTGEIDGLPCFVVVGTVKRKSLPYVTKLMELTRKIAATESIYKGKALVIDTTEETDDDGSRTGHKTIVQKDPSFFKLQGFCKDDLVLPKATADAVKTAVFSAIEDAAAIAADGLPTKRTIVLDGAPGTGKTLTMTIAAELCSKMGRTFINLKSIDHLEDCIKMADRYGWGPAMFGIEDIDRRMFERDDETNRLLNAIDGVDSKKLDILFLMTTNHKEKLIETFQRAGRSDWIITLPVPDQIAAAELLKRYATEHFDLTEDDYMAVGKVLADANTLPSNIAEVARRSRYYRIAEKSDKIGVELLESVAIQVIDEKRMGKPQAIKPEGTIEEIARRVDGMAKKMEVA